jgi:hypothetical protein
MPGVYIEGEGLCDLHSMEARQRRKNCLICCLGYLSDSSRQIQAENIYGRVTILDLGDDNRNFVGVSTMRVNESQGFSAAGQVLQKCRTHGACADPPL